MSLKKLIKEETSFKGYKEEQRLKQIKFVLEYILNDDSYKKKETKRQVQICIEYIDEMLEK